MYLLNNLLYFKMKQKRRKRVNWIVQVVGKENKT